MLQWLNAWYVSTEEKVKRKGEIGEKSGTFASVTRLRCALRMYCKVLCFQKRIPTGGKGVRVAVEKNDLTEIETFSITFLVAVIIRVPSASVNRVTYRFITYTRLQCGTFYTSSILNVVQYILPPYSTFFLLRLSAVQPVLYKKSPFFSSPRSISIESTTVWGPTADFF